MTNIGTLSTSPVEGVAEGFVGSVGFSVGLVGSVGFSVGFVGSVGFGSAGLGSLGMTTFSGEISSFPSASANSLPQSGQT